MYSDMFCYQTNTRFFIDGFTTAFRGTGADYDDVCHICLGCPL